MVQLSRTGDLLLSLFLPTLILLHTVLSPYTKVEESFTLQATHDILTYGIPTQDIGTYLRTNYDHFSFPGAVPRTFTGALVLAAASKPAIALGIDRQIAVRATLGLLNAFTLLVFREAVARSFGRGTSNWFLLFQASQFHVIYYVSRTLPNMLAFGLTTLALSSLLPSSSSSSNTDNFKKYRLAIYLLSITSVIFRSEIALLLFTVILHQFYLHGLRPLWQHTLRAGLTGSLIGLFLTISIDSFFWQRFPLWPEFSGFYFNAIQGRSINWGKSPRYFYFINAFPRLLLNPITWGLCIPLSVFLPNTRKASLNILLPLLGYVVIYSIQPHKEWRFIAYIVPGLTTVAGMGANWIWTRRGKNLVYRMFSLALVASVMASFAISAAMLGISRLNYPGAEALRRVHELVDGDGEGRHVVRIWSDTLSCSTGITRFMERKVVVGGSGSIHLLPTTTTTTANKGSENGNETTIWIYDKTESPLTLKDPKFWEYFDYVLVEDPERVLSLDSGGEWEVVDVVNGFAGVKIIGPGIGDASGGEDETGNSSKDDVVLGKMWRILEEFMKRYITRGRWIRIQMEPKIRILERK